MSTTPPGWYDDERGALRWWDGRQWTEHVQTPDPEPGDSAAGDTTSVDAVKKSAESAWTDPGDSIDSLDAMFPSTSDGQRAGTTADGANVPVPAAPPGYPGGFTGGPAPSGAFIAATEPKKSKLWILWVVLGVVLLGVVVLAVVVIPILLGLANSAGGPSAEDEAAAVAAVELYDEAWQTADCEKWEQATTENLRVALELADCTAFTAASESFSGSVNDYVLTVTSVESAAESDEETITVETTETYNQFFDADGNPTETAQAYEDHYAYIVVPSGDEWVVNEALSLDQ